jgi:hypothetical protein
LDDTVNEAKHELRNARHEQQEKAAAFWQNTVEQGRILRQTSEQMRQQSREQKGQQQ